MVIFKLNIFKKYINLYLIFVAFILVTTAAPLAFAAIQKRFEIRIDSSLTTERSLLLLNGHIKQAYSQTNVEMPSNAELNLRTAVQSIIDSASPSETNSRVITNSVPSNNPAGSIDDLFSQIEIIQYLHNEQSDEPITLLAEIPRSQFSQEKLQQSLIALQTLVREFYIEQLNQTVLILENQIEIDLLLRDEQLNRIATQVDQMRTITTLRLEEHAAIARNLQIEYPVTGASGGWDYKALTSSNELEECISQFFSPPNYLEGYRALEAKISNTSSIDTETILLSCEHFLDEALDADRAPMLLLSVQNAADISNIYSPNEFSSFEISVSDGSVLTDRSILMAMAIFFINTILLVASFALRVIKFDFRKLNNW